ncbi:pyruvate dehydrogenase (acetyl-transferring) E1 component subunit alpha, partial [Streptomyces sp. SID8455]|nr:pyruvate dehydrogenase (acetyl-transferring) E1 component subunit alpha [Streptomyces sp. SID8455]
NADDATRYRVDSEVEAWRAHDPVQLLERELTGRGLLDDEGIERAREAAERMAAALRDRMNADPELAPMDLFTHVYAEQTSQLREQAAALRAELDAEQDHEHSAEESR